MRAPSQVIGKRVRRELTAVHPLPPESRASRLCPLTFESRAPSRTSEGDARSAAVACAVARDVTRWPAVSSE